MLSSKEKKNSMIIKLNKNLLNLLIKETIRKSPVEACGILFGDVDENKAAVKRIILTRNALNSPHEFQISAEELIEAISEAETEGIKLIGFFHSHKNISKPSRIDTLYMKLWPEKIWLIISSIDYTVRAYRIINNKLHEVHVEISD
ncbi:TPA: M67 family peptidase [Candidatus Bathyarchaeota archaeon]|nr:M67 family peptidase [Candidatus Bathyarchaeota archaeon]